ncbi:MAG: 4a-hydroxytetrahydrobiopterin dehydratase [Candidatus Melainabacteria bacterium]|nr:4a-hydroxytetrahydrobiopterin dehydratase [Candidatus Melainabacteria bacterium]
MFNHHGARRVGNLAEKTCVPCRGGVPPLTAEEFQPLLEELSDWEVKDDSRLLKSYKFNDFKSALKLANRIGEIAEQEGHHPDLLVRWGELKIELWTHKINGLTESDFILAAKIDKIKA